MKAEGITIIRNALNNMRPSLNDDANYARGVLVGVVSGLMARGMTFKTAIKLVKMYVPSERLEGSIPESWEKYFV